MWINLSFSFLGDPSFWLIAIILSVLMFCLGYYWQSKESRVKWLVEQANLKTKQIIELERINKEMDDKNRILYAKELELTLANDHLQGLEKAKSKFVSVTTHQLRTPLSAIKWTLDLASKGQLGPITPDQEKFLSKALMSTERVISIVNDLLKIDLIDENNEAYDFKFVDLNKLIEEVSFEFANQVATKQIKLDIIKPKASLPNIELEPNKIRMVLENLLDNAIKYTPRGGVVELKISDERLNSAEPTIVVSVTDSGIGIPPEETDKIFQKFFRATNAIKAEPDGSGLGLFLARDMIEKHKGSVWFKTEPGKGTVFSFSLPLHQKKV